MSATLIVDQLRALGVDLSVSSAGKLHVEAPLGTLTEELRLVLAEHRKELIEALSVASPRHRPSHDPRPDLTDDAERWVKLLEQALAVDGDDGDGVYWALLGARCVGAELLATPTGLRLRPRRGAERDYSEVRPHLERNAVAITALFRS